MTIGDMDLFSMNLLIVQQMKELVVLVLLRKMERDPQRHVFQFVWRVLVAKEHMRI